MVQNRSPAVMQQRMEADDSLDDFPTPSWGTRALINHVILKHVPGRLERMTGWEPACNRGYMAKPMAEVFQQVYATDVHDYGYAGMDHVQDFLFGRTPAPAPIDWTWSNPPFRLAEEFIFKALEVSRVGCAMLVRSAFLEGGTRYRNLFSKRPPTIIAQFAERIILTKGIVRDPAKLYFDEATGKMKRPSTATAYVWLVWVHGMPRLPFDWIPPCRQKMERPGDYILPESTNHTTT